MAPAGGAKGKAKGLGGKLGRKVGPLPLWVWLGAAAALLVFLYLRRKGTVTGEAGYGGAEVVTGAGAGPFAATPQQTAGGSYTGATETTAGLDPAIVDYLEGINYSVTQVAAELDEYALSNADALAGVVESFGGYQPPQEPPAAGQVQTASQGVRWAGGVFTTRQGLANALAPGVTYEGWASRHPSAAARLVGPAPKPKAKAKAKPQQPPRRQQPPAKSKPGRKVVYSTYKKQVKLKPGQKLKFTKGKGYYAG